MKLTERPAVTVTALLTLAPAGVAPPPVTRPPVTRPPVTRPPVTRPSAAGPVVAGPVVADARLIVGSVGSVPFAADATSLLGASPADFGARAEACAEQAAAGCTPLSDGEASAEYLRHLVFIHARQALWDAFASASQPR